jgi:hypothetical protein
MAQSRKAAAGRVASGAADATAAAASQALRAAVQAAKAGDGRLETGHLTELCSIAADHLAMAHEALFTGHEDADDAIEHLDAALTCLKQLDAETVRAMRAPQIRRRAS